ncbi:MAG TPA: alpha/beta hydrolase [Anaerolineaceae bacterium]
MKPKRKLLIIIGIVLVLVLVIPLLVPIVPMKGLKAVEDLADPDSKFIDVNGVKLHYKILGSGEPAILLLHGFGASVFSWREVINPLAQTGTVIAYDRPAFGLTRRPLPGEWLGKYPGDSPYSLPMQVKLLTGLMDALKIERAVLVGNSAGGTVALAVALDAPERVKALILVDAAVGTGRQSLSPAVRFLLNFPQVDRFGPLTVRQIAGKQGDELIRLAWFDPSRIGPEVYAGYRKPLLAENWDRGLWEFTKAAVHANIENRLNSIHIPTLVVSGDTDRIIPVEQSKFLAESIAEARLEIFPQCGHVPHEECPDQFLAAVLPFIRQIQ